MKSRRAVLALRVMEIADVPEFGALLAQMRGREGLVALDSAAGEPGDWSWIAWAPLAHPSRKHGGSAARAVVQGSGISSGPDPKAPQSPRDLADVLGSAPKLEHEGIPGPFQGGFMGAIAYDCGVPGEEQTLPRDPWTLPTIVGGFYVRFFVFDHRSEKLFLVQPADEDPAELVQAVARALSAGSSETADARSAGRGASFTCSELRRNVSTETHCERIERARAEIAQGEYYQANLAHAFEGDTDGDPLDMYLELRRVNPAPYMAYVRFDAGAILSASPELLVQVTGRQLVTRPIKGTAPRDSDPALDRALASTLLESSKDRAELAMIVDLLRNDFGRVASTGSVRVAQFPELRSYAGVHHLMADVVAELATGKSALDVLCSVFPGGSITGAPKLRSMRAIAELEGEGRGFFTGSAGFLDVAGNACFNILIRTIQWRANPTAGRASGQVRFHVGGGITWSSNARDEDTETLVKGAWLAKALGHRLDVEPRTEESNSDA